MRCCVRYNKKNDRQITKKYDNGLGTFLHDVLAEQSWSCKFLQSRFSILHFLKCYWNVMQVRILKIARKEKAKIPIYRYFLTKFGCMYCTQICKKSIFRSLFNSVGLCVMIWLSKILILILQYECRVIFSNDIVLLHLERFDKHVSFRQKRDFLLD